MEEQKKYISGTELCWEAKDKVFTSNNGNI